MDRFTNVILRRGRLILIAWALLAVVGGFFAFGLEGKIVPGGEAPASSQAERVAHELSRNGTPSLFIVVTGPAARPDAAGQRALGSIAQKAAATPGVRTVAPLPLPSRTSAPVRVLGVSATGGVDGSIEVAHKLLDTDGLAPEDSHAYLGGYGAHREELVELSRSDLVRAERVGIPLVFAVLLLTFGSLWATSVPLVIAFTALLGGLGAAGALAYGLPLSEYVTNSASMIGLALAVDYAMFLVQRTREALMEGAGVEDAVRAAMRTTGVAIFWSGFTVIVAEATMLLVDSRAVRTAALGMILVTFSAIAAALVGAPIILRLLGHRILRRRDRARLHRAQWYADFRAPEEHRGFWARWGRLVTGRAPLWLAGAIVLLLAFGAPVLKLDQNVGLPSAQKLPADSQVRKANEISGTAYGPGVLSPVEVIVHGQPSTVRGQAEKVAGTLRSEPAVRSAQVTPLGPPDTARISVTTARAPADDQTHALVRSLRDGKLHRSLAGVRYEVGGETAMRIDATDALFASLPKVLVALLALVLLLLVVAMRSIVLPVKAVLLVVASLAASVGGLLLLSTTGLGAHLIGWSDPADLHPIVPITIVAIVIALSTDYEVILISRIAERYAETGDNGGSILDGVAHTGRVISSAAAIMIAVFFGFALSDVTPVKQIGVGLALAVLIDATVVRGVLVPASMQLMGRWNWWFPGRRRRAAARVPAPGVPAARGAVRTGSPPAARPAPGAGGPPAPAAPPAAGSDWTPELRVHAFREGVMAVISLLLVASAVYFATRALGTADDSGSRIVLPVMLGLAGVVLGYYFGRVPAEAQAARVRQEAGAAAAKAEAVQARAEALAAQVEYRLGPPGTAYGAPPARHPGAFQRRRQEPRHAPHTPSHR